MIDRLNYCTHAIASIMDQRTRFPSLYEPNIDKVFNWLKASVKFILPERGELLDLTSFDQRHADLIKLPYKIVAVEAHFPPLPGEILPGNQEASTRRIGLYVEMPASELLSLFPNAERPGPTDEGVLVIPIYYVDSEKQWRVGIAGAYVPYDQEVFAVAAGPHTPASEALLDDLKLQHRPISKSAIRNYLVPIRNTLLTGMRESGLTDTQIKTAALADAYDEHVMMVQLCTVLNCGNVEQSIVPVPEKLARARAKSGQLPFYEYRMLVLSNGQSSAASTGGSTGSTVRGHLRRGHIRRLPKGIIWVSATIVNAGSQAGFIDKDYAVQRSK